MTQRQLIRSAVVALSTRRPRCPWLPTPIRRALDTYRLRLALDGAAPARSAHATPRTALNT